MKKVNEIVNFLLGKEKRAYAVAGVMSEGAYIEHPLSIHSAYIGTSRKPAGNTAIIRCMAAMFVMLFTLGVGNAWGETIWDNPAGISEIGTGENKKVYPEFDVWYYVYAQNHVTNYTNQKIFWVWHTQTYYYEVRQTVPQTTDDIPANLTNLIQVKFTKDATTDTVRIWAMTPDNVEKELFFRGSTGGVLMAQREGNVAKDTTEHQKYWNPKWTFTYESKEVNINNNNKTIYSFAIEGKRKIYSSGNYLDYSDADVRAVYKKVNNAYNDFNSSVIALKTASATTAPYLTKWSFIKVPQKYNAAPTAGGDTGHGETVQVSTTGNDNDWHSNISNQPISSNSRIYFKATAPTDDNYEFVGWYKEETTDQSSGSNNLVDSRLAFDIPASAGNHNYVAVYRYKRTIYYSITANVNNSTLGSAQVSLNQDNWTGALSTLTGSFRSGFKNPQITFYFKTTSTDPAINLQRWNATSWPTSKYNTTNTTFVFDQTTGIMALPVTVYSPSEFTSSNPFVITITAKFTPAIFYKGVAQKKGDWSSVDACTVKAGLGSSYNWNDATNEVSGFIGVEEEEGGSANKDIYFKAVVSDPNRYRAKGWYNGDTKVSSEADYHQVVAVTSYDQEDPTTLTLQADFEESTQKYYRAEAVAVPNVGTVKAGFTSDLTSASAIANASEYNFNASFARTAYFEAIAPNGYQFRGWSATSDGAVLIEGATYNESFTVSSTSSGAPTTITRYAIFREKVAEVRMWDADDTDLGTGEFADAIANSDVVKIRLLSSVTLSDPLTITNPVIIDLDGNNLTGSSITINPGSGKEVKFINTDSQGLGKVDLTTEATGVSITSGNLILDGSEIQVIGSGANTYGISVSSGATFTYNGGNVNVYATNNAYGLLMNGDAQLQGGTISARAVANNAYAVYTNDGSNTAISGSAELVATAGTASSAFALKRVGGTVVINGGGFRGGEQDIYGEITVKGGYYANKDGLDNLPEGYVVVSDIPSGLKFSTNQYKHMVIARNNANYPTCVVISKKENNPTLRFHFNTLEKAIAYVMNNANDDREKVIMLRENCTLSAGNYTIPRYTTLVVPGDAEQVDAEPYVRRVGDDRIPTTAYCTLTLEDGVHIDVNGGSIEVGGKQTAGSQTATAISRPGGDTYGLMLMNGNSSITLNSGASFYAWGFVQGTGTIDVRRGAIVKEQFQINDWKTIVPTCWMAKGTGSGGSPNYQLHVLPINQYFIQNIEVKATYRPGARLTGQVCANVLDMVVAFNDVGIIGVKYSDAQKAADSDLEDDVAIFLMDDEDDSDDTWVRKSYDVAHDQQLYEVNNSAYLGSLSMYIDFNDNPQLTQLLGQLGFSGVTRLDVDSKDFVLALSNNFKIHLLYGNLTVTQNTVMLPGMVMEVNKKSTMTIAPRVWDDDTKKWINTPQTLSLYDYHQWGTYAAAGVENNNMQWAYATKVKCRPGGVPGNNVRDISSIEALGNAQLIVHGTVDVQGYLRTTKGDKEAFADIEGETIAKFTITPNEPAKEGGASIISTIEDAGTIIYSRAAQAEKTSGTFVYDDFLWQTVFPTSGSVPDYEGRRVIPALLRNDAESKYGSFTPTEQTAVGQSFCFVDFDGDGSGEWMSMTDDDCFTYDQYGVYYIKPRAYVPIKTGKPTAEADHTYRDHYNKTGKIYILLDGCQWWEVEAVEGHPELFKCEHPDNTTYYYWNGTKWAEKKYKVEWMDYDGTGIYYTPKQGDEVNYYYVTYHTTPQWFGNAPIRLADDNYTYEFTGWSPTPAPVEDDVVYTATYEKKVRSYMITFKDKAGNLIENQFVNYGSTPSCQSYTLAADEQWTPAIGIVTGNQTYTVYDKNPGPFTITFVNWNGATLKTATNVAKNTSAEDVEALYNVAEPTKAATQDETFTFTGWTPTIVEATADAVYTATFSKSPKKYTIKFVKENGNPDTPADVLKAQELSYGETPTPPTGEGTTKAATDAKTYTLVWSPLVGSVTGNQNYIATFAEQTRQYTVTWANGDQTLATDYVDYDATPAYSGITPTKAATAGYIYTFSGWSPAIENVTGNATYTAQFTETEKAESTKITNTTTPSEDKIYEAVTITTTGTLDMGNHELTVDELVLQAEDGKSGQLLGTHINAGVAYYDLKLNTVARRWVSFGVPWTVNAYTSPLIETKDKDGNEANRVLTMGSDFDIIYYNGDVRAMQGAGSQCWESVQQLEPGKGYMIAFTSPVGTVRFTKKANVPINTTTLSVKGGNGTDRGINAIANPRAYHTTMSVGTGIGQVYEGGIIGENDDEYTPITIDEFKYIVGKAVYVKLDYSNASVPINPTTITSAPKRRMKTALGGEYLTLEDYYTISLASVNGGKEAMLYVLPMEDKEDEFITNQDLSKMGMSTKRPQMWVNRYGVKLCLNTTAPVSGVAEYPVSVYAPKAGEYTISLASQPSDEYIVYLTRNGEAVWNLSDAPYTLDMNAGTDKTFGLRLTAKKAPQVATGMDEAIVDAQGETRKVLINNQVFIIRGNNVYTAEGQLVK